VTVGLLPSFAEPLSEALVLRLARDHPAVQLRLSIGYAGHLAEWLDAAELDIAVLYAVKPSAAVEVRPLLDEALWVVGPPGSELSTDEPVHLAEVCDRLRILPSTTHALRSMVERVAAKEQCRLQIEVETNSMNVQRRLVAAGLGWTVLPSIAVAEEVRSGQLAAAPLNDPGLRRRLLLAIPGTRRIGFAARGVAEILVDEMARSVKNGAWPSASWLGTSR
jgi:DNA-binding transcriptional LysR family regulator